MEWRAASGTEPERAASRATHRWFRPRGARYNDPRGPRDPDPPTHDREEHAPEGRAEHRRVQGAAGCEQGRDPRRRRGGVQRQGRVGPDRVVRGEAQADGALRGPASELEEGDREAPAGSQDRVGRGSLSAVGIRTLKPTSPARRYLTYVTNEEITKKEPEKILLEPTRRTSARNTYGRITVRHRGGGAKRMLRTVDFRREKFGVPARVAAIEYDPNRSARLALLHYRDGEKRSSSRPSRSRWVTRSCPGRRPTSCPVTRCRSATSRSARSSTTSSSSRAAARRCAGALALRRSSWRRRASGRPSSSRRARCGWCRSPAWRRSARWAISTMRTCRSARRAGCGGSVSARQCAVR